MTTANVNVVSIDLLADSKYHQISVTETVQPKETKDIFFPFNMNMNLLGSKIMFKKGHIGDTFDLFMNPNTPVGTVSATSSGSTITMANTTPIQPGFFVGFGTTSAPVYRVLDKTATTFTVDSKVSVTGGDAIFMTYYIAYGHAIQATGSHDLGYTKAGVLPIVKDTIAGIRYHNHSSQQKQVFITLETSF